MAGEDFIQTQVCIAQIHTHNLRQLLFHDTVYLSLYKCMYIYKYMLGLIHVIFSLYLMI